MDHSSIISDNLLHDGIIDIAKLMKILPHRYPMLMIDRVLSVQDMAITAVKAVSVNEPYFQGHFADQPIMPGVLIIEAMAQALAVWAYYKTCQTSSMEVRLLSVDGVKFRKQVTPGDILLVENSILHMRGNTVRCKCVAKVDNVLVAESLLTAMSSAKLHL